MSGTANSYQSLSQPKWRRSGVSPGGSTSERKPKVFSASGIECSFASTSTVESCSSRRFSAGASANQLSPNVYGMTSGGTMPSTWSIRKNGVPSTVALVVDPAHPGDRHVGQLADQPDHLELVVESVRREDGDVLGGGGDAGHPLLLDGLAVLCHRPVRMMVSDDIPLESTPLSTVTSGCHPAGHHGGQPLRHHRRECGDVAG